MFYNVREMCSKEKRRSIGLALPNKMECSCCMGLRLLLQRFFRHVCSRMHEVGEQEKQNAESDHFTERIAPIMADPVGDVLWIHLFFAVYIYCIQMNVFGWSELYVF